jgi:hypothetical protein
MKKLILLFVLLLISCGAGGGGGTDATAPDTPVKTQIVPMHHGVLLDTPWQDGETLGGKIFTVTTQAEAGSKEIKLADASTFKSKLFAYLGTDGKYRSNIVDRIEGNSIFCMYPLFSSIATGGNVFHFYRNWAHSDQYGDYAIADQALGSIHIDINKGTHLLFGDSWLWTPYIRDRVQAKLPNALIFSSGVGGDTTQRLINRFDADVTPLHPDYVWVMVGTNDAISGVSVDIFLANMKIIVEKIREVGAIPILFDVSVLPSVYPGSIAMHDLCDSYSEAIWASF